MRLERYIAELPKGGYRFLLPQCLTWRDFKRMMFCFCFFFPHKIYFPWSVTFSWYCECSMVTLKIHGKSTSGKVISVLEAVLELVFTLYTCASVFNVGLHLFCSQFCCQLTLILHVSANAYCLSHGTATLFHIVPSASTFWNNISRWHWISKSHGNVVIKLWHIFSLWGLNEKKKKGVNLHTNKKLRSKWTGSN